MKGCSSVLSMMVSFPINIRGDPASPVSVRYEKAAFFINDTTDDSPPAHGFYHDSMDVVIQLSVVNSTIYIFYKIIYRRIIYYGFITFFDKLFIRQL